MDPLCRLCSKTFRDHFIAGGGGDCLGDFDTEVFDPIAAYDSLTFRQKLRFVVRHPVATVRETGLAYRRSIADQVQMACEQSYSLEHSRMVRESLLEMSWPAFMAFVLVSYGLSKLSTALHALGLGSVSKRFGEWWRDE